MDSGKFLLFGAVAVGGYFLYEAFFSMPASWTALGGTQAQWSALSSTAQSQWNALPAAQQTQANALALIEGSSTSTAAVPATSTPPPAPAPPPPPPAASVAAGGPIAGYPGITSLSSLASQVQSQAGNPATATGDQWNYYVNKITGLNINPTIPAQFQPVPATGDTLPMTFAQYWQYASPLVAAQTGLAGYNHSEIMAGLGALVNRQRAGMGDYVPIGMDPRSFIQGGGMSPFYMDANTDERSWN